MPPAPFPADEAQRLEALLQCHILDTPPESAFDDLTRLAARLCAAPIALVSLVDGQRQWFKSRVGLDATQTPREQAFCGYTILSPEPLVIPDAASDPRTADNVLVTQAPGIRFYAGVPLILSSGEPLGTLCVIDTKPRDISTDMLTTLQALGQQAASQLELRLVVRKLETANAATQKATEFKSIFIANMSHEIRTPMTAILGFAEVLLDSTLDEQNRREHLETIKRNGEHLLALINEILDLSKIEAGQMEIETVPVRLDQFMTDQVAQLQSIASAKGLILVAEVTGQVPQTIHTDPLRLRQVLGNLIGNALKFTQAGGVTVRLRCAAPRQLMVEVVDTGIGIKADVLHRLFDAFVQADTTTTRRFGGTGLGLHISRRLAQMLGGDIAVTSIPGAGSTFTLTLATGPVAADALIGPGPLVYRPLPVRPPAHAGEAAVKPLAGVRVFVAEDGPDNRRLITFHLRRAGAEVTTFDDGAAALAALTVNGTLDGSVRAPAPCDLLLTDMQMPQMDGYTLASTLRARGWTRPIVALTAHAMAGDSDKCLAAGCDAYVTKPIDRATLVRVCSDLLVARVGVPSAG